MNGRRAIDVRGLPSYAFGSRDTTWWGVVLLIAIESTMLALLVTSYFYVRQNFLAWPPTGLGRPAVAIATLEALCLLASILPNRCASKAARAEDLHRMRRWLLVTTAMGVVFLVLRVLLFERIQIRWDSNVYGSIVWTTLGFNTFHALSGVLENAYLLVLLFRGPVEKKHLVDVELSSVLWNFVIGTWIPIYAIYYLDAVLFTK